MDVKLQRTIREQEVEQIIPFLPRSGTILEIGAGAGWQAKRIAEHGFDVKAIDLPVRGLAKYSEFDIIHYDGYNIPFPSECFSAVYASNVLDHIPHVYEFQKEIHRVLEPDGVAIIVLPTTSWRFWSILTHYPHYLKQAGLLIEQALMPKKWEMKRARVEILTNTTKGHVMGFLNTSCLCHGLESEATVSQNYSCSIRRIGEPFSWKTGGPLRTAIPTNSFTPVISCWGLC